MAAKLALARWVVTRSHGAEAAEAAEAHFTRVVRQHEAPDDVPRVRLAPSDVSDGQVYLPSVLATYLGVPSASEGRRLIEQGGVKLDGTPVSDFVVPIESVHEALLQVGKRRFVILLRPEGGS
jgi:tyrosyl-tRNA synthetase